MAGNGVKMRRGGSINKNGLNPGGQKKTGVEERERNAMRFEKCIPARNGIAGSDEDESS